MIITAENNLGEKLVLDRMKFPVVAVDGLTPATATINTTTIATVDGSFFNTSRVNPRNIVLTIVPEGDPEKARLTLYRYFKTKYPVRLYFKTKYRDVFIDGYTENVPGNLYDAKQTFQISVICPQPFFNDVNTVGVKQTTVHNALTFPFKIPEEGVALGNIEAAYSVNVFNEGDEMTGLRIILSASGMVSVPTITNRTTGEKFSIEVEMSEGEKVEIDTRKGHKSIILTRNNGTTQNILNKIVKGSSWFNLQTGENIFDFTCLHGTDDLQIIYYFNPLYEGV